MSRPCAPARGQNLRPRRLTRACAPVRARRTYACRSRTVLPRTLSAVRKPPRHSQSCAVRAYADISTKARKNEKRARKNPALSDVCCAEFISCRLR